MKKFLFMLTVMIGIATGASAQKTDLSLSYGGYTQMDATDCHDGWHHVNNAWGALNVGVNFQVARNFYIGPSYTFSSCTAGRGPEHSSIAYHAIMLNGRYNYWRNSIVTLYGHLGLGAEISHMMPHHGDSYNQTYSITAWARAHLHRLQKIPELTNFAAWTRFLNAHTSSPLRNVIRRGVCL